MKYKLLLILIFVSLISSADDEQTDFLNQFVEGTYVMVGKAVNSDKTYHGSVNIAQQNNVLRVKRNINGKEVIGSATIEPVAVGDAKVLRILFSEDKQMYEQTCLIAFDLNNYARISCYVYPEKNSQVEKPGYEVLFHAR